MHGPEEQKVTPTSHTPKSLRYQKGEPRATNCLPIPYPFIPSSSTHCLCAPFPFMTGCQLQQALGKAPGDRKTQLSLCSTQLAGRG